MVPAQGLVAPPRRHTETSDREYGWFRRAFRLDRILMALQIALSPFCKSITNVKRSVTFLVMFYCILGGNYNLQLNLQSWVFPKVGDDMTQKCEGDTGLRCSTRYRGKSFQPTASFLSNRRLPDSPSAQAACGQELQG